MTREPATGDELAAYAASLDFELDDYQQVACEAVEAGAGVLVAAPTGAGKTLVGEFAVYCALNRGGKAFYTTPIKALSNQKYLDFAARFGADRVGLLTGDSSINGEAPVVVMTTEVLRNMLYAGSPTLGGLTHVVMDEVHYLADRARGAVWEEVIIHLAPEVQVISLSATVSNAEEFGEWLAAVRPQMRVVVSEDRPVPLFQHMFVGGALYDLFVDTGDPRDAPVRLNPELTRAVRALESPGPRGAGGGGGSSGGVARGGGAGGRRGSPERARPAGRADVIHRLDRSGLLPAICFVFSRSGCDAAVEQLLRRDVRLVDDHEGERIRRIVEERCAALPPEDLAVLGYHDFVAGLSRGFAAHHAGLLPTFREIVEELFTAGRVQVVFATETLALGINMPARTVVLERLVKFNGIRHAELTPAEYTQLTGRAGRRGIDVEGHAVVLWQPGVEPEAVGGLAATRTYPLRSSFRPTYNMALNLVARVGRDRARQVLESSFAQFQADRTVVGLARAVRRNTAQLADLAARMTCHLGDFAEYAGLRAAIKDAERDRSAARAKGERAEAARSLGELRVGDVVWVSVGRHTGWAVVVAPQTTGQGQVTPPAVVTEDRQYRRLDPDALAGPVGSVTTVRLPRGFNARNPQSRRDLATTLRIATSSRRPGDLDQPPTSGKRGRTGSSGKRRAQAAAVDRLDDRLIELRARLRAHPCHDCPDREDHARVGEQWWRLHRDTEAISRKIEQRTSSIAGTFERVCEVLADTGYLAADGRSVTAAGQVLRGIYTERDLLTAQALRAGVFDRLDPASLAAVASALVHEARTDDLTAAAERVPNADVRDALDALDDLWADIEARERATGLPSTSPPDRGIVWVVHRWASGAALEVALRESELAAGDFVRRCKQVIDLLSQLGDAAAAGRPKVSATARRAADRLARGVVAADRID